MKIAHLEGYCTECKSPIVKKEPMTSDDQTFTIRCECGSPVDMLITKIEEVKK